MSQHVELMTKRQDLCLQRRSRPVQSDQRQANQPANISHQLRASPDSTSLASRIEFPTMTGSNAVFAPGEPTLRLAIWSSVRGPCGEFHGVDRNVGPLDTSHIRVADEEEVEQ